MTISITVQTHGHRARVTATDTLPDGQAGPVQHNDLEPGTTYTTCAYSGRVITVAEIAKRHGEWNKGVRQDDGGYLFPDLPLDASDYESRDTPDGPERRAVYED